MPQDTISNPAAPNAPLRIATLPTGAGGGVIGVTFAPGKQQTGALSGTHRRDLAADLDVIAAWNAAAVVTLVEPHELEALGIAQLGEEVRRRHMEWHHWPIQDFGVPDAAFTAAWPARSAALRSLLACGGRVLVHCKGGLGRAGMIAARLLVETGHTPTQAIAAVRAARSKDAIETRQQEQWVAAGIPMTDPRPGTGRHQARDRAIGSLLGLAIGDALGAAIEFQPKPRFALLGDLAAGGIHHLQRGQWTDDTAMALALADSLVEAPTLDPHGLMRRFLDWHDTGAYSCTGTCFDIGNQTREALERFRRTGDPLAGSTDPAASGNGALMRLAPVAIRHWRDPDTMHRIAALQTRTTHGSPMTMAASHTFARMLAAAIDGTPLPKILDGIAVTEIQGGWRGLHRDAVAGTGFVVRSLQAAVWAVSRTTNFRAAVLLAANLGDDADTTAAIAGQFAGALYGAAAIPLEWRTALAWHGRLAETAGRLFDAGWPEEANLDAQPPFTQHWMTQDWSLLDRLRMLASFAPVLDAEGFIFSEDNPPIPEDGIIVVRGTSLGEEAGRFYQALYDYGWVQMFDWMEWRLTARGISLLQDPAAIAAADADDLARILTTCVRADRFCDGYLADAFRIGLIQRVVERARQVLDRQIFEAT